MIYHEEKNKARRREGVLGAVTGKDASEGNF